MRLTIRSMAWCVAVGLILVCGGTAMALNAEGIALDSNHPFEPLAPAVQAVVDEHRQAMAAWQRKVTEIKNQAQLQQQWKTENPGPKAAERLLKLAEANRGSNVAFQALFIASRLDVQALPRTMAMLSEDFAADPLVYFGIQRLGGIRHDTITEFLRKVIEKNSDRRTKVLATLALAASLDTSGDAGAERLKLVEQCLGEYKDVVVSDPESGMTKTAGELADRIVRKAKSLSVGSTAQDIVGEDADGKAMKLSDFKGKVVMLTFFADWLPMRLKVESAQEQIARTYQGRPLVVLGVDCDLGMMLKQSMLDKRVTFRSWIDGRTGPIGEGWQVRSFPTVFLIDPQGVIRQIFRFIPDDSQLDDSVADLVESAEQASGKAAAIAIGENGPEAAKMEPMRVIRKAWKPIWSPDGTTLLCTRADTGKMMFYDLKTGAKKELPVEGKDGAWSPDGSLIAFVKEVGPKRQEEVWACNSEGGDPKKLVDGGYPLWIGSGKDMELVFHSRTKNRMYSISPNKPEAEPALFYAKPFSWYPAVSKSGRLIAFGPRERLVVVEQRTGQAVLEHVVPHARGVVSDFSPDDALLACGGFDGDPCGLWVVDMVAHTAVRAMDGPLSGAAWSDDGTRLAFDKRQGRGREVWVVGRDWLVEKLKKEGTPVNLGQ